MTYRFESAVVTFGTDPRRYDDATVEMNIKHHYGLGGRVEAEIFGTVDIPECPVDFFFNDDGFPRPIDLYATTEDAELFLSSLLAAKRVPQADSAIDYVAVDTEIEYDGHNLRSGR